MSYEHVPPHERKTWEWKRGSWQKIDGSKVHVDEEALPSFMSWNLLRLKVAERVVKIRPVHIHDNGTPLYLFEEAKYREEKLSTDNLSPLPYSTNHNCEDCFDQFFPLEVAVTNKQALHTVKYLSEAIKNDAGFLKYAISYHADFIVTKWHKKGEQKRFALLTKLFGSVKLSKDEVDCTRKTGLVKVCDKKWAALHLNYARSNDLNLLVDGLFDPNPTNVATLHHRLEETLNLRELSKTPRVETPSLAKDYATSWLLPYLDIKSLAENPLLLLSLLHGRTAYSPEQWLMFDNMQMDLAESSHVLDAEFNAQCVVMTGEHYGSKLVPWDREACHRREIIGYRNAHLILTAQHHVMRLLRDTIREVLAEGGKLREQNLVAMALPSFEGRSAFPMFNSGTYEQTSAFPKWDRLVKNGFSSFGSSISQTFATYVNQPFSSPPKFDLQAVYELIQNRFRLAQDDLELIQTDPAYLQYLVKSLSSSLHLGTLPMLDRWTRIGFEIIGNAFSRFIWWRQAMAQIEHVLTLSNNPERNSTQANRETLGYATVLLKMLASSHLVHEMLKLHSSLCLEPGFEQNYTLDKIVSTGDREQYHLKNEIHFEKDPLLWSLSCMGHDANFQFTMDPQYHFRVLDHHIRSADKKERNRLSEKLVSKVTEMADIDSIRISIECDPSPIVSDDAFKREPLGGKHFERLRTYSANETQPLATSLAKPLRAFYKEHPWPQGPRDEKWLSQATASRRALADLFCQLRASLLDEGKRARASELDIEKDMALFSVMDNPQYQAEVAAERAAILQQAKLRRTNFGSSEDSAIPVPQLPQVEESTCKYSPVIAREKTKTRPEQPNHTTSANTTSTQDTETTSGEDSTNSLKSEQAIMLVRPEDFDLFQAMFPEKIVNKRKFAWVHFVRAIVAAGFRVIHGSGSAVSFKNEQRSIVFHRPHPDPTIDPIVLMSMGKRLKKWFGWGAGTFEARK